MTDPANSGSTEEFSKQSEELNIESRYRVAVRFAVQGDLRFISHHDTMRMFEKALVRAGLPLRYSGGFNPRPRISLPVPRPVGVATEADILVLELAEPVEPADVMSLLAAQLPQGVRPAGAWKVRSGRGYRIDAVEYAVELAPDLARHVEPALKRLLESETWVVSRKACDRDGARPMDVRSCLVDAGVDAGVIRWRVRVEGGSIRPAEFLAAIGLDPAAWRHRVTRTAIIGGPSEPDAGPQRPATPES